MKKIIFIFTILLSTLAACTDPNEGELFVTPPETEAEMSVTDVLESQPETYSMWISFLKYADFYNALKNTDKVTIFCPNNQAVQAFLAKRGVSEISQLDKEYAKNVVRTHIIDGVTVSDSTLNQEAKAQGTLTNKTLFDSYLSASYGYTITDVDDDQRTDMVYGADSVYINNKARLAKFSVTCNNGAFFTMGDVIEPLTENIVEKREMDGSYKIFSAAIRADHDADSIATLVKDTTTALNGSQIVTTHRFTCFAVPDQVYNEAGITDVASLKQWLTANSEYSDPDQALTQYLRYHFLSRDYSTAELFNFSQPDETLIYDTQLNGQAITASEQNGQKIINQTLRILRSDIPACNGTINKVNSIMPIYHPTPVTVRWDFLNQADIISAVNSYGASKGYGNVFSTPLTSSEIKVDLSEDYRDGNFGAITSITYQANESKASYGNYRKVGFYKEKYASAKEQAKPQHGAYMNNYLCLNLGYAGWAQMTTPVIIAGKYKVVLHYIKDITLASFFTSGTLTRFDIDDHSANVYLYKNQPKTPLYDNIEATLFSNITFEGSTSHTFKVTMMDISAKTNSSYRQMLDYIEFIPVE